MKLTVRIEGELDHHNAARIRQEIDAQIRSGKADCVVFDLRDVTFMDSSGIGVLLGRYKQFADRDLFLTGANPEVDRLLKLSGVYTLMPPAEGGEAG